MGTISLAICFGPLGGALLGLYTVPWQACINASLFFSTVDDIHWSLIVTVHLDLGSPQLMAPDPNRQDHCQHLKSWNVQNRPADTGRKLWPKELIPTYAPTATVAEISIRGDFFSKAIINSVSLTCFSFIQFYSELTILYISTPYTYQV